MRLWSLHPRYLDVKGLLAAWREGLLAQKVLEGLTKGYTHHPQLDRFRAAADPLSAISRYLSAIADEADARAYRFDRLKIHDPRLPERRFPSLGGRSHTKGRSFVPSLRFAIQYGSKPPPGLRSSFRREFPLRSRSN